MNIYNGGSYSANRLIKNELEKIGAEVKKVDNYLLAVIGGENYLFSGTETSNTSLIASRIVKNKYLTSLFLKNAGVSVPEGRVFEKEYFEDAKKYAAQLKDFVVKPVDGHKGKGVSVSPQIDDFKSCWEEAVNNTARGVLIEKAFVGGSEARYLVVQGVCVGVVMRKPPEVVGDGVSTLEKLIHEKNIARTSNPGLGNRPIVVDAHRVNFIKSQGFELNSVIPENTVVVIDKKAGLSTGGEPHEIYDSVSPYLKAMSEYAVKSIPGLDIAGVDIISNDHFAEGEVDYVVIELNTKPGIAGHHYPVFGDARNVAKEIVDKTISNKAGGEGGEILSSLDNSTFLSDLNEIPRNRYANRLVAKEVVRLGGSFKVGEAGKIMCSLGNRWFTFHNGSIVTAEHIVPKTLRKIVKNKTLVKQFLSLNGVPVIKSFLIDVRSTKFIDKASEGLEYPVCLKSMVSSKEESDFSCFYTREEFLKALSKIKAKVPDVVVEEHVQGFNARVVTVFGDFVSASLRVPLSVSGDGKRTVQQLIEEKMKLMTEKRVPKAKLFKLDAVMTSYVKKQGYELASVPEKGIFIQLKKFANSDSNAESHNIEDFLNDKIKAKFSKIASIFEDAALCGIDVVFLSDPRLGAADFKVAGVNFSPSITNHHFPYSGKPVNIAASIALYLSVGD